MILTYSDPLSSENAVCCKTDLTAEEQRLIDYYDTVRTLLNTYTTKGDTYLRGGKWKESETYYNIVNDLNNLYFLLEALNFQRDEDIQGDDGDQGSAQYVIDFELECIAEHFKCLKIDITSLLDIYGVGISTTYAPGLGYMAIGTTFIVA